MQNSSSRCKHQWPFVRLRLLYSVSLHHVVALRASVLAIDAVLDEPVPGVMKTFPFVYDAIAPERLGEIERPVGGGIDRLLVALGDEIGNATCGR